MSDEVPSDGKKMTVFDLTRQLMEIPSLTGEEEALARFLSDYLTSGGFHAELLPVADRRYNLLARLDHPSILLCTHLDTVPPLIPFREDSNYIYGRGACDAKGIIAAMLSAGERLQREGVRNFGYLFTAGEETDSLGARVAGQSSLRSDYIIVGEPTDNRLVLAHKGNLTFDLATSGRAAHSAYPAEGDSAIDKLLDLLNDLRRADFGQDPVLGRATLNIGVIAGGVRPNVIADQASARIMIRTVTPAAEAAAKVSDLCQGRAHMTVINQVDSQTMLALDGFDKTVVSFGTDIPYLRPLGQPLLIGPGSILTAHSAEERVAKAELQSAVEIYCRLVKRLSAQH